jgi:hypothetical protein
LCACVGERLLRGSVRLRLPQHAQHLPCWRSSTWTSTAHGARQGSGPAGNGAVRRRHSAAATCPRPASAPCKPHPPPPACSCRAPVAAHRAGRPRAQPRAQRCRKTCCSRGSRAR